MHAVLAGLSHKHAWTTKKLSEFAEGYSIQVNSENDLERDVLYCCTCKGKAFLLPSCTVPPLHLVLMKLGDLIPENEQLTKVLDTVLEIMKKTQEPQMWPKIWKDVGFPRLLLTNAAFIERVGGINSGAIDVLRIFGFKDDAEYLIYKEDISTRVTEAEAKNVLVNVEKEVEALKSKNRILTLSCGTQSKYSTHSLPKEHAFYAVVKRLSSIKSRTEYGEEDYKDIILQRDMLKEVTQSKSLNTNLMQQARELLDRMPVLIGEVITAIQEKEHKRFLQRALGLRFSEDSEDEDTPMSDQQEAARNDQLQSLVQQTQEALKQQNKERSSREEMMRQKEQEELTLAIQKSLAEHGTPASSKSRDGTRSVPVGLKNIANVCSFNSLLQTYFMLPKFRFEILKFRANRKPQNQKQDRVLKFMTELQKLFATLILTQKAVADPTDVIKALLTGAKSSIQFGHQEDVHEINLLILDTIEEAYTFNQQGNMVKECFYGDITEELFLPSDVICNKDSVAHILLDIEDHHNLYSSLDAYMDATVVYNNLNDTPKVTSFGRLPDVLIFQLKRTQFSKEQQTVVKVNDAFKFDETIYMDRYLHSNSEQAAVKRKQVREWEKEKRKLMDRLKWYTNYKNSGMALDVMLQGTLDYISTEGQVEDQTWQLQIESRLQQICTKVETEIQAIRNMITELQTKIDTIYADIGSESAYMLHSILVHDGFAGVGHYWTFTKDHRSGKWFKFNDTFVSSVSKDTVFKESEGGHMTRSAYCLFYVSELHVGQAVSIPVEQEENLIPELLRQSIMMNDSNRSDYSNRLFGGLLEQTLLAMQTD